MEEELKAESGEVLNAELQSPSSYGVRMHYLPGIDV